VTRRQQVLLAFIGWQAEHHGQVPSRLDLAEAVGLRSSNTIQKHVDALVRDGALERPKMRGGRMLVLTGNWRGCHLERGGRRRLALWRPV
jgi:SOS-response transcriptional repressor LexA